ncbi:MAG: hypothetical protein QM723_26295 [Myxococcaceae bacterium]
MLRLQVDLRWRDSVVVSRSFEHGIWAGPTKYHPFPIEGFGRTEGFVLALREGDVYSVRPPMGGAPVRLGEGMRCSFRDGELTLNAWVTREHQAVSLAWMWLYFGGLGLLTLWELMRWFGIVLAFLLYLLPHQLPKPVTVAQVEPLRPVKVRPFVPEVKPPPLPETPKERLKMLMEGKRAEEIFKDAGKKQAARERDQASKKVAVKRAVAEFGMIGLLNANPDHAYAVLGSLNGAELNKLDRIEGGVVGGVVGNSIGESFGAGGLGLAVRGGGTGTGLGSLSGVGTLSASDPARDRARELAHTAGTKCFADKEGRAVVRVEYSAGGKVTAVKLLSPSGLLPVDDCLLNTLSGWKLPSTPNGGSVRLVFRGEL